MKSTTASVVVVLLMVINNPSVQGILETNDANQKCKCLRMSEGVPLHSIKTIFISPPSGGCRNTEFIVTLKSGGKICVDPKCKWLNLVLRNLRRNKATTPNVNIQKQHRDST
ncbi:C-X-C motif chemokine 13 [Dromiciops gliroides]|uniref:C-X-C motif chemokine 13 n=1 Tax=Dromiciops gliroides TaxID=33562 RepID=UPI001CC4653E|nr:C-X-C motif chemokine 13 [Dromiciops gliroides]